MVVLVTGCGSGIGNALAKQLWERGDWRVVITGRRHSLPALREQFAENERFLVRELDILDEAGMDRLVNEICCIWGRVDVLINNAGVCFRGVVEHMDVESELLQLKTNYLGPMALIRAVLPVMREQRGGQIINISSVSGMMAMPTMGSYSASKHALEAASEALWYEARPFGIRISLVEPGFVKSDAFRHVVLSKKAGISSKLGGPHSEYYRSMTPFIERLMAWSLTPPEKVASRIIRLIGRDDPPLRTRVTIDAVFFNILRRLIPSGWFHKLLFYLLPGWRSWGGMWKARRRPSQLRPRF